MNKKLVVLALALCGATAGFADDACVPCEVIDKAKNWLQSLMSCDPNEITGPAGVGEKRYVKQGEWMDYTVYFENMSDATAAAQEIRVTLPKDPGLDWSTLELGEVAFGDNIDSWFAGKASGENTYAPSGSDTQVKTVVTVTDETVEWYLRSWDPNTPDHYPANVADGFLPPNDPDTHCGEGHVRFRIKVKDAAAIGSKINASATIVFDTNPPITTDPAWWNTVGQTQRVNTTVDGVEMTLELFVGLPYGELPEPGAAPKGYSFGGWYTALGGPHGAGRKIEATSLVEAGDEGLYQYWEPNAYTVHFEPNSGEGAMPDQAFVYDVAQALANNRFVKVGHSFAGWTTNETTAVAYADGAVVSNLTDVADGVVNLYAAWTANVYRVTFDSNGGSAVASIAAKYGEAIMAPESPTRTGYTFAGWYAGEVAVSFPVTVSAGDLALTAHWTANSFTMKFDANGGTGTMADVPMTYDMAKDLPACSFARTDYVFVGWAMSADGDVAYANCAIVKNLTAKVNGVVTLYAQWKKGDVNPRSELSPAAIAGIAVGSAAVVGVAGHFIGRAVSESIGKKKGNPTYKQFKAMKLVVPELDAQGITYKNKLVYHPAKGTVTGKVVLTVQKGDRTQKIRAKAKGSLKDGVITGTLDAKGLGVLDFTVK